MTSIIASPSAATRSWLTSIRSTDATARIADVRGADLRARAQRTGSLVARNLLSPVGARRS